VTGPSGNETFMSDDWKEGDAAVLKRPGSPPLLLRLASRPQPVGEEGVIDVSGQIGQSPGGEVHWSGATYRLFRPSLSDLFGSIRRGAQIVTPKDAAYLLYLAGVGPGASVAEAGAGSGALTIALAYAVGAHGHVTSYDRRPDFLAAARANLERAGLSDRVTFRERDVVKDGLDERDLASVLFDLPEPWEALAAARDALRPGGYTATYTPTYNQLERTVRAFRRLGYDEVRAVEVLERGLHVGEGGTRPEFEMLGHTGFLAAGRKVE
jgi:tRNA (adenine57-N1/adenine58-N1)-methyltransferase catalytic subunit